MFLSGLGRDVDELKYTVVVTEGADTAKISLLEPRRSREVPLRAIEVLGKTELGMIGAEEISNAVIGMLGVGREEFDGALELQGFGKNGANVLIKPNVVAASGKVLKNNRPRRTGRKLPLVRCAMCDLFGRVGLAKAYTVKMEGAVNIA